MDRGGKKGGRPEGLKGEWDRQHKDFSQEILWEVGNDCAITHFCTALRFWGGWFDPRSDAEVLSRYFITV